MAQFLTRRVLHISIATVWRLLIVAVLPCGSCSASSAPHANMSKRDEITVTGTASTDISMKIVSRWQATSSASGCQRNVGLGVSAPIEISVAVNPPTISNLHRKWHVFRDEFTPGRCGWMMKSIEVFADPLGYPLKIDRVSNLPNRISYVPSPSESRPEESWANNSDVGKPVHLYCDFTALRKLDAQKTGSLTLSDNPCAKGWEKYHGTDLGKKEHILLPTQHNVSFAIAHYQR